MTGRCEGDWFECHTCSLCTELVDYITAHIPCFCHEHGNLLGDDILMECAREAGRELPGFAFSVGRRLVAIRQARQKERRDG